MLPNSPGDPQIARLSRFKSLSPAPTAALGPELITFFKTAVARRQTKFGKIADCWNLLVPEMLSVHCSLESFSRGSLTVIVDSASHLYELKQLLLAGLEKQLLMACKSSGLKKVALKRGTWYDDEQRVRFGS